MKEKYETDIKKEIKKLQRHRDFFKQLIKDSEIKDKTKMVEARRKIEDQMEMFRELEKEYKQKKLTKVVDQNANELESKYNFDDSSSDGGSSNSSSSRSSSNDSQPSDEEVNSQESDSSESPSDKEWLNLFLCDSLRKIISEFESTISSLRQNKSKVAAKKNKEKIGVLEQRVTAVTQLLTKVGEVQALFELLDGKSLRKIRVLAGDYCRTGGQEDARYQAFLQELDSIITLYEQNMLPLQQAPKEESKTDGVKEEKDERS